MVTRHGVRSGTWCARWYMVCAVVHGVWGGTWCARWYMVCEVVHGVRGGTWCARWYMVCEVVHDVWGGTWCVRWYMVCAVVHGVRGGSVRWYMMCETKQLLFFSTSTVIYMWLFKSKNGLLSSSRGFLVGWECPQGSCTTPPRCEKQQNLLNLHHLGSASYQIRHE